MKLKFNNSDRARSNGQYYANVHADGYIFRSRNTYGLTSGTRQHIFPEDALPPPRKHCTTITDIRIVM